MRKIFVLSLILVLPFIMLSQNSYDDDGNKHGYWEKYKDSVLVYQGNFIHGTPDSVFTYYYANGMVKARNDFYSDDSSDFSYSIMYYNTLNEQVKIMAEGEYHNKQKNGTWKYYNLKGVNVSIENWVDGLRFGEDMVFFPTGELCEYKNYYNDVLVGKYETYYLEGNKRYHANYLNGVKSSSEIYYYKNGQIHVKGEYFDGVRNGDFIYYAEDGKVQKIERYKSGYKYEVEYIDKELEASEMEWLDKGETEWDENEPPVDVFNQ